jgi:hypothetical protein
MPLIPNGSVSDKTRVRRHTATADAIANSSLARIFPRSGAPPPPEETPIHLWNMTRHTRGSSQSCVCRLPVCPTEARRDTRKLEPVVVAPWYGEVAMRHCRRRLGPTGAAVGATAVPFMRFATFFRGQCKRGVCQRWRPAIRITVQH